MVIEYLREEIHVLKEIHGDLEIGLFGLRPLTFRVVTLLG